jgi:hypothetical protein
MGWSNFADNGTMVANDLWVQGGASWVPWADKNQFPTYFTQNYAISIDGIADYLMVTEDGNKTANVICKYIGNSK